jgi:hypothetical protein
LSLTTPTVWVAQRATVSVPVTARVLANGNPVGAGTLNYQITRGAGTLSALAAQTDSNGYATVNLQLSSVSAAVQVSICVASNNSPCQIFNATVVATSSLQLQPVAGSLQIAATGQSFRQVVVRVVDSSGPPHGGFGASVLFQSYAGRVPQNQPIIWSGGQGFRNRGCR